MNKKWAIILSTIIILIFVLIGPFVYFFVLEKVYILTNELEEAYLSTIKKPMNLWMEGTTTITIQSYEPKKEWVFEDPKELEHFRDYLSHVEMHYVSGQSYLRIYLITLSNKKHKKTYGLQENGLCAYYGSWGSTKNFMEFYRTKKGFWDYIIGLQPEIEASSFLNKAKNK